MSRRDWVIGLLCSVALHLLVVAVVALNWSREPTVRTLRPPPAHIQATVVERSRPAPPQAAPPSRPAPRPATPPAPPPARTPPPPPRQEVARPSPPRSPPATRPATPPPAPPARPTPPRDTPAPPKFEQPDLDALLAAEELSRQAPATQPEPAEQSAVSDEHEALLAEYEAAIRQAIEVRWQRPPSARNGMEVLLRVRLAPGGDVLDVQVLQGSGDANLDRSAVSAVRNAGRLPVPTGADFDAFRSFQFRFRPEDMRL